VSGDGARRWSAPALGGLFVDLGRSEPHNPRDRRGPDGALTGEGMGNTIPTDPTRRASRIRSAAGLLLAVLATGCANDRPRPIKPSDDLFDPNPSRRVQAVTQVRRTGASEHVSTLIELLDDEDETVRLMAGTALRDLTGRDSGYLPYATPAERRLQVEAWRRWWAERPAPAGGASRSAGR
jgi:hypothetical protein